MKQPRTRHQHDIEVKRSRFLATLLPMTREAELKALQQELKQQHPKASHVCYGARWMTSEGQIQESFSDDGEPSGTSGPPILKVLQHKSLINCGVLITRYFGGTKLGTGGLQRAYSQATSDLIQALNPDALEPWIATSVVSLRTTFANEADLRHALNQLNVIITKERYDTGGPCLYADMTEPQRDALALLPIARLTTITS